jgi:predicted nucleic acid-binding protein
VCRVSCDVGGVPKCPASSCSCSVVRHAAISEILKRFAVDREFWALIEVTSEVLAVAETLVADHPLRTLDAIHLASSQLFAERLESQLTFVTADARQGAAASAIGLATQIIAF